MRMCLCACAHALRIKYAQNNGTSSVERACQLRGQVRGVQSCYPACGAHGIFVHNAVVMCKVSVCMCMHMPAHVLTVSCHHVCMSRTR